MSKEFDKKVGRIISEMRKGKRLTQIELARQLGIAKSTLACYETGARGMNLDTFFELCRLLEIDPNDIVRQL